VGYNGVRTRIREREKMKIKLQEYAILLDLLAKVNDSVNGSYVIEENERERLLDAHKLSNKFLSHALTILNLSRGSTIQDLPSFPKIKFIDSASIDVLTRAGMEAYLKFHLVFVSPKTPEEKVFRYLVHKIAGIAERQNYISELLKNAEHDIEEKEELNRLKNILATNNIYIGLKDNRKEKLFQGKEQDLWRLNPNTNKILTWYEIGINAGFGIVLAHDMYKYLSGCAHSSFWSISQVNNALENKEIDKLIQPSINLMKILTANMIEEYCKIFPETQKIFESSGAKNFVSVHINIGKQLA
jgi:hypothetical protein